MNFNLKLITPENIIKDISLGFTLLKTKIKKIPFLRLKIEKLIILFNRKKLGV
jgi:hypothetical protein